MGIPNFQGAAGSGGALQELLNRDFVIEDPEILESLVDAIPSGASSVRILWRYDLPKHRAKVRCAVCGAHRHWKGYVVELDDARHALLGGDCGRQAFGFEWDEVEADFVRQQDRQRDLRRYTAALPIVRSLVAEVEAVLAHWTIDEFETYVTALRTHFGKFSQALAKAARLEGRLDGFEQVPDLDAARRLAALERPGLFAAIEDAPNEAARNAATRRLREYLEGKGKVLVEREVIVGYTSGRKLFLQNGLPKLRTPFRRAHEALVEAATAAANDDDPGADLTRHLERIRFAIQELDAALDIAKAFNQFTAPDNTALIATWSDKAGGAFHESFTAFGRSLRRGGTQRLEVSLAWAPPNLGSLELLRAALRSNDVG